MKAIDSSPVELTVLCEVLVSYCTYRTEVAILTENIITLFEFEKSVSLGLYYTILYVIQWSYPSHCRHATSAGRSAWRLKRRPDFRPEV